MKNIPNGTQVIHHLNYEEQVFYKEENGNLLFWNESKWEKALIESIEMMIIKDFAGHKMGN